MDVNKITEDVINFSSRYKKFFSSCGLYQVGSSVAGEHNDIDVVLAGLDFRAVASYDGVYLKDAETLVKRGFAVEMIFEGNHKEGEDYVRYDGMTYGLNLSLRNSYLNIYTYCKNQINPSELVEEMIQYISCLNKIKPRATEFEVYSEDYNVLRYQFDSIDFIIHAENLFVKYWKKQQEEKELPYLILHEWENADTENIWERPVLCHELPPEHIDVNGRKTVEEVMK